MTLDTPLLALLAALSIGPLARAREVQGVRHVDATLEANGELLGVEFVDVDVDGRDEICLAVRTRDGRRELRLHRVEPRRVAPEPFCVVEVLDDALAFGFADVREEPGRELFFLTRSGAWSYSLQKEGYRGNVSRLVSSELVYDVPDLRNLEAWRYVLPAPGGDRILLPGRTATSVWGPARARGQEAEAGAEPGGASAKPAAYVKDVELPGDEDEEDDDALVLSSGSHRNSEVSLGPEGFRISRDEDRLPAPFLRDLDGENSSLLASGTSTSAPALLDVNGDGLRDLLTSTAKSLAVHLADASGAIPAEPSRIEALPEYLVRKNASFDLNFHDLDGDPYPDLVAQIKQGGDGFENAEVTLQLLRGTDRRLLPEKPDQVLRFEAAELRYEVSDVDGDGTPDLYVREFKVPSLMETVTGLEFSLTHLLYLGEAGGARPLQRKPALRHTDTYDENTIQEAIKNRELALDCDGDGIGDMVEIDLQGRVAIRRITLKKSLFGARTWTLEETPWRRFEVLGDIESVGVRDLNGDGIGDVFSEGDETLTILLSTTGGRR